MKGHLCDVGYDAKTHDQCIDSLKRKNLGITDAIESVVAIYQDLYGQDAYEINCGNCEEFAADVIAVINGTGTETDELHAVWHDEMLDCTEEEVGLWSHKFICYQGRYYDSQSSEGVDEWRHLSCFGEC